MQAEVWEFIVPDDMAFAPRLTASANRLVSFAMPLIHAKLWFHVLSSLVSADTHASFSELETSV